MASFRALLYTMVKYISVVAMVTLCPQTSDFSLAWLYTSNRSFISSPAEANGIVYSGGGDSSVYAFDATAGTKLWSFKTGAAIFSSVAISNGVLYVSESDGNFYAFSLGGM